MFMDAPKVTFLCVTFVNDLIITGADDGFLYIWKDLKIIKKQNAHGNIPILCLKASKFSRKYLFIYYFLYF